ncbi:hypothetical protein BASA81_012968 [Batrachochytrium salamandrivorans]|nr:hypothetical protein BASA81_012968 [Batrachochytrium salamandrivorans]
MQDTCDSPDIVVVGFQELLHQGNAALLSGVQYSHWAAIHPHHSVDSSIPTGPPDRRYGSAHIDGLEPWIWMVLDALSKTHGPRVDGDAATPTDQDSHQLAHHPYRVVCAGRHTAIGIAVFVRHHLAILALAGDRLELSCYSGQQRSAAVSIDVVSTKGKILLMDEVSFLRHHRHGAMGLLDEQPIHFLPTYKFNMGSHGEWQSLIGHGKEGSSRPLQPPCRLSTDGAPADISSSFSKKRLPAYCDRILHAGRGVSGKGYWNPATDINLDKMQPGVYLSDAGFYGEEHSGSRG